MNKLLVIALSFVATRVNAEEFQGAASATRATCMVRCLATPRLPAYGINAVMIYSSPESTGWSYVVEKDNISYQGAADVARELCSAKCLPLRVQTTGAKYIGILEIADGKFVYRVAR